MFQWLTTRVVNWLERRQQRQIDALLAEKRALKSKLLELNGGKPKPLCQATEEARRNAEETRSEHAQSNRRPRPHRQ
jgi:hypothetical protein